MLAPENPACNSAVMYVIPDMYSRQHDKDAQIIQENVFLLWTDPQPPGKNRWWKHSRSSTRPARLRTAERKEQEGKGWRRKWAAFEIRQASDGELKKHVRVLHLSEWDGERRQSGASLLMLLKCRGTKKQQRREQPITWIKPDRERTYCRKQECVCVCVKLEAGNNAWVMEAGQNLRAQIKHSLSECFSLCFVCVQMQVFGTGGCGSYGVWEGLCGGLQAAVGTYESFL